MLNLISKDLIQDVSKVLQLEQTGDQEDYQKFFAAALDKYGVDSPTELDDDEKVEFYDYIDNNWSAKSEGLEDACWKDYEAVGFKMKDGKRVPNCVPKEEAGDSAFPHVMYDPDTGDSVEISNEEEHNIYAEMGWVHELPNPDEVPMESKNYDYLSEPAVSQSQQKLFAMALAYKRGEMSAADASDKVKELAKSMSEKDLADFASTKISDLPKTV